MLVYSTKNQSSDSSIWDDYDWTRGNYVQGCTSFFYQISWTSGIDGLSKAWRGHQPWFNLYVVCRNIKDQQMPCFSFLFFWGGKPIFSLINSILYLYILVWDSCHLIALCTFIHFAVFHENFLSWRYQQAAVLTTIKSWYKTMCQFMWCSQ